jgi:hypothetical protein
VRPLPCLPPYRAMIKLIRAISCDPANTAKENPSRERFLEAASCIQTLRLSPTQLPQYAYPDRVDCSFWECSQRGFRSWSSAVQSGLSLCARVSFLA